MKFLRLKEFSLNREKITVLQVNKTVHLFLSTQCSQMTIMVSRYELQETHTCTVLVYVTTCSP